MFCWRTFLSQKTSEAWQRLNSLVTHDVVWKLKWHDLCAFFGGFATSQLSKIRCCGFWFSMQMFVSFKIQLVWFPKINTKATALSGGETLQKFMESSANVEVIRGSLNIHLLRWQNQLQLYNQNLQQNQRRSPCQKRREVFLSLVRFLVVVGVVVVVVVVVLLLLQKQKKDKKKQKVWYQRVFDVHAVYNCGLPTMPADARNAIYHLFSGVVFQAGMFKDKKDQDFTRELRHAILLCYVM